MGALLGSSELLRNPSGSAVGKCSKGVDPVSDGTPKLIAIDEEADHQIVYRRRLEKANGTTHKTLDPCPQISDMTSTPL
jgi:hypothetical protein